MSIEIVGFADFADSADPADFDDLVDDLVDFDDLVEPLEVDRPKVEIVWIDVVRIGRW